MNRVDPPLTSYTSAHPTALLVATDLQHILVFLLPGVSVCLFSV